MKPYSERDMPVIVFRIVALVAIGTLLAIIFQFTFMVIQ
jgi:hypothetical protein